MTSIITKGERQYVVIVGARETGDEDYEYRDAGGQYVIGPMSLSEATEYATSVENLFKLVEPERFVYGKPFVEVEPLQFRISVAEAVVNWFKPEED